MALPPAFLEELRARTPLPGLIGRKTRLARNGRQWKGCCPFHNEKTPSFYVYDDHFHCFGCGAHGDAITFLMRAEGASFPEAVERLAGEAGMQVPKATPQAAERERRAKDLYAVCAAAEAAFRRRLMLPEGRAGLDYLRRRGLTEETIARFGLGWSGEGRGALAADLKSEGITPEQLVAAGLMKPRDPDRPGGADGAGLVDMFFNRVIFPIRDRRGRTISFGGRILGDGQPKYVNGPETELFSKRRNLYGLDLAREGAFRGATVVVVEGYMDVIALHQAGFGGAVAPLGTALTAEQMEALWQVSPEPVLCFDGDAAGARAAGKAAEVALPLITIERRLKIAVLTQNEDPDTLIAKGGSVAFQKVVDGAKPLSIALFDLCESLTGSKTAEQRAALRKKLEDAARSIGEKSTSIEFRKELLRRFDEKFPWRSKNMSRSAWQPRPKPGELVSIRGLQRTAIDPEAIRLEQSRNLLAILLGHPDLLSEVVEALASLDLPPGDCSHLREALLTSHPRIDHLDSMGLIDHLRHAGWESAVAWATTKHGLSKAADPEAQPKDALDEWWQYFGFLRGKPELMADQAEARRLFEETYDGAAAQRLIRITQALAAVCAGEADQAQPDTII